MVAVSLLYMETVRPTTPGQTAGTWWHLCLHDEPESELLLLGISCMLWAGKEPLSPISGISVILGVHAPELVLTHQWLSKKF